MSISQKNDALGHHLWDFYHGKKDPYMIEREDGFIDVDSDEFFTVYRQWPQYVHRALRLVRGRVLDVGCGAGRHALYLQQRGFRVIGIDNSPLAIKVCKLRGLRQTKVMPIEQLAFADKTFDTVLMMWANFGLLGFSKKARRILKTLFRITSDQAQIIADVNDPYKTIDPSHLQYHRSNRNRGRMAGQLRLRARYRSYIGPWFDYLFASKAEVKKLVRHTGWHVKQFLNSKGSSYIVLLVKDK